MPKIAVSLEQWADGADIDLPVGSGSQKDQWQNGNLGSSQAHYAEGESVPYRAIFTNAKEGTLYALTIEWDTTQQGKHALDYLTTWDTSFPAGRNETVPYPLIGVSSLLTTAASTFGIVADPRVTAGPDGSLGTMSDNITQLAGQNFTFFGGVSNFRYVQSFGADGKPGGTGANADTYYSGSFDPYTLSGSYGGNSSTSVTLVFTYTGNGSAAGDTGSFVLAWGGHIATRADWGGGMSAAAISGSPYHMRLTGFFDNDPSTSESVGQQDRSLSSAAVVYPGAITVEKQTTPDGSSQSFNFEMTRPLNTVDIFGGQVDLTGDGKITGDDDGHFVEAGGEIFTIVDGNITGAVDGDGKLAGFTLISGKVDVNGNGTITIDDKYTNVAGTGITTFALTDNGSKTFGNLLDFAGYTVQEVNIPTNWQLNGIDVTRTDITGNSATPVAVNVTNGKTVTLSEADVYKLTFNDAFTAAPNFTVTKTVTDVDGGGATAHVNAAGDMIKYDIVVANTGNQSLTGVIVTDKVESYGATSATYFSGDTANIGVLDVGETWTYHASYAVTQADIDNNGGGDADIDNLATVSTTQLGPKTATAVVPLDRLPDFTVTKTVTDVDGGGATAHVNAAGDMIKYDIVVANTGNQSLTGVIVTDKVESYGATSATYFSGDTANIGVLDVGETWTYHASYAVTQADIDNNGGGDADIDNLATVSTTQLGPKTATAVVPLDRLPDFTVTKTVTDVDGGGATAHVNAAGDMIKYDIVVANTGNQSLTGVIVTDKVESYGATSATYFSGDTANIGVLDVGETWTYHASYAVTQADIDNNGGGDADIDNLATVSTTQLGPKTATAVVPLDRLPDFTVTKTVTDVDGGGATAHVNAAGDMIKYDIVVANTGNQSLTGVIVTDKVESYGATSATYFSGDTANIGVLDVGETWTYHASYAVTQADIDNNGGGDADIDNLATVSTTQLGPKTATAVVPLDRLPDFTVTKTVTDVDGGGATAHVNAAGDMIKYDIVVANTGNQSLTGVIVTDKVESYGATSATYFSGDTANIGVLDVGETWTYHASYAVTQADIDNNGGGDADIDNLATVSTTQLGPKTATAVVPLDRLPDFTVTKTVTDVDGGGATAHVNAAGDMIKYDIVVANTGNQSLTGVIVTDKVESYGATSATYFSGDTANIGVLDVGETWTYHASYAVTQADIDNNGGGDADIDNLATVSTTQLGPKTATAVVPLDRLPDFTVTKTPDKASAVAGTLITYDIAVHNIGNQTLNINSVTDKVESFTSTAAVFVTSSDANGNGKLDVGETWHYSATYTVTQADIDTNGQTNDGDIDNRATVVTTEAGTKTADAAVGIVFPDSPIVDIEKYVSVDGGATWLDADTATGPILLSPNVPMFKYVVTNTGGLTLTNITVKDDNGTPLNTGDDFFVTLTTGLSAIYGGGAADDLAVGGTATGYFTGGFKVGQYTNVATVNATSLLGVAATPDSDAANYYGFAPITINGSPQFNFPNSLTQIQPKLQGADAFIINPLGYISWDFYTPDAALARIDTNAGFSSAYAGLKISIAEIWNSVAIGNIAAGSQAIYRVYVANEGTLDANNDGVADSVALANNANIVDYTIVASSSNKGLIDLINSDPLIGNFNSFSNIENAITKASNGFGTTVSGGVDKVWSSPDLNGTAMNETPVTYDAGAGNDAIYGRNNTGAETLNGGSGHDMIEGRDGVDIINGGDGNDQLYGSLSDDIINGGAGSDILFGSYGTNTLTGGTGDDTFIVRKGSFATITDFGVGNDQLRIWVDTLDNNVATGTHSVNYDSTTGIVTVNGTPVALLESGSPSLHPASLPSVTFNGTGGYFLT